MLDRAVHVLRLRWRSLARRREVEAQLADEIAYHLAEEADRRVARGDAARRGGRGRASRLRRRRAGQGGVPRRARHGARREHRQGSALRRAIAAAPAGLSPCPPS